MNWSFLNIFPAGWKFYLQFLLFPVAWFFWSIDGGGYELIAKVLFLSLPLLLLSVAVVATVTGLASAIFRPSRAFFTATLLIAWWDGGKAVLLYWSGIVKFVFFLFGWIYGAVRIVILGIIQTIKDVIFLPATIIFRLLKGYAAPGIPWIAVFITLFWILLESAAFAFILKGTIINVISALANTEISDAVALMGGFLFLFMFIGGSFACMHGLVLAFENKKYGNIIKMLFIEFFVMFIEVMFFYREFVSSLAPFLSQMTNEQFQMNVYHILIIATMSWVGVRAGVWFFFAKFGTPTLLMIISREGLLEKAENGKIKVVGGPLLWIKEIVDELQGEINWFSDKGREITEAFVLPPVQIFACMTNFVMIVLTGRILFSLPLHTLKEIKDTKQLLDQIAKEEKK
ncbi:MAG: hypothetical protein A2381_05635 [Bdellovibrionales bacterium RIFOXYB1_FULL_37_110]|nr:MAG: hypothetical protein A2417_06250 [Bdellovibrionales bacterium RIFOXYC1_FULL_37_79]OFZ58533.1 MAG: hypothetical protein A2381_05635 [Bdellovibrionales bacterium RIFOXYB1_FULL_37_110]OFZ63753.1 MAG: hypothetical protein A2577_07385 [Bdellovibrionales bacterium RIFOXYD1_FULL_36_51]